MFAGSFICIGEPSILTAVIVDQVEIIFTLGTSSIIRVVDTVGNGSVGLASVGLVNCGEILVE